MCSCRKNGDAEPGHVPGWQDITLQDEPRTGAGKGKWLTCCPTLVGAPFYQERTPAPVYVNGIGSKRPRQSSVPKPAEPSSPLSSPTSCATDHAASCAPGDVETQIGVRHRGVGCPSLVVQPCSCGQRESVFASSSRRRRVRQDISLTPGTQIRR